MPRDLLAEQAPPQVQQPRDLLATQPPASPFENDAGGLVGIIKRQGFLPTAKEAGRQLAAIPLAASQEAQRLISAIPGSRFGLIGLLNLARQRLPQQIKQIPQREPQQAGLGRALTDITAFTLPVAAGGGLAKIGSEALSGLPKIARLLPTVGRMLGGGAGGAILDPQDRRSGAVKGILTSGSLEAIGSLLKYAPNLFVGKLAKTITDTSSREKNISADLYKNTFAGTGHIKPVLSSQTQGSLQDVKDLYSTTTGKLSGRVGDAIKRYEGKSTLSNLHFLRSDINKESAKMASVAGKDGLLGTNYDRVEAIQALSKNIVSDTENNLSKISPNKFAQYQNAQQHFKQNVLPFRNLKSIRDLLGAEKKITPALFRELGVTAKSPARVRELAGLTQNQIRLGNFLHRKYLGIPVSVWLAMGVGGHEIHKHIL